MLPFVLGAVALGATGYGVKEYIDSDIDRSMAFDDAVSNIAEKTIDAITDFEEKYLMPDWYYKAKDEDKSDTDTTFTTLQNFYTLKQTIYDSSYQEFQTTLKKIKNLNIDKADKINIKNNLPIEQTHIEEITNISNDLTISLYELNLLFQKYIEKITTIVNISNDYKSYSKEASKILSDTLVLSNTINDILNIKVVSKKDKPTKSSKELVEEVKKVLVSFKENPREKLVA
jgi:hypothetical protein